MKLEDFDIPADWKVNETEFEGIIGAQNYVTGEVFNGTVEEFYGKLNSNSMV